MITIQEATEYFLDGKSLFFYNKESDKLYNCNVVQLNKPLSGEQKSISICLIDENGKEMESVYIHESMFAFIYKTKDDFCLENSLSFFNKYITELNNISEDRKEYVHELMNNLFDYIYERCDLEQLTRWKKRIESSIKKKDKKYCYNSGHKIIDGTDRYIRICLDYDPKTCFDCEHGR
jgi:hypothetical protein